MSEPDAAVVTIQVARALQRAGVPFIVGGSIASSSYGEPRATQDIDLAIRLQESEVPGLVLALGPDFDVDEEMVREAARDRRSANIFYLPYFMKIDLFVRGDTEYDRAEFARARMIEPLPGELVPASSPEDNLLWKMRWFRQGGEISDQQWRDVLGLLRINGPSLDLQYVRRWAGSFGVAVRPGTIPGRHGISVRPHPFSLRASRPDDRDALYRVWRGSVEATHHFLAPADLEKISRIVRDLYLPSAVLTVAVDGSDTPIAFLGAGAATIDSLFVDPAWHGRGVGKRLVESVLGAAPVVRVDVNEANSGARLFYERLGFVAIGRSETDESGLPYPLLHMERRQA